MFFSLNIYEYLWILVISIISKVTEKLYTSPFNPILLMLSTEKSVEIFPKHNEYFFISEYLVINWYLFCSIYKYKTVTLIIMLT